MSQLSEFIDRAKLEAEAEKRWPLWLPTGDYEIDREDYDEESAKWQNAEAEEQRQAFLAGAAAYAALLDAETTGEWGAITVGLPPVGVVSGPLAGGKLAAEKMSASGYFAPISRRVVRTPWLPSEGGES